jgi:hypothetical protein
MAAVLPSPEVLRCYFDEEFDPPLPALCLRWQPEDAGKTERLWELPDGVCMTGTPPQRFGISIQRRDTDSYTVRLLWDRTCLIWSSLVRAQLLGSALAPLLAAMGTDLWYLLDQPIRTETGLPRKAA